VSRPCIAVRATGVRVEAALVARGSRPIGYGPLRTRRRVGSGRRSPLTTPTALRPCCSLSVAIPVVALTASDREGEDQKALQAGCLGYITKPFDIHQFPKQVAVFLQGDKAEDSTDPG
jgi:hypothetical protein